LRLLQAFPLLVAGCTLLLLLSPSGLWGIFLSPVFGAQGTLPSLLRVFFVIIAYYSVSLFSLGGGRCVQGAMLIWPKIVCGNTAYRLAHLVVCIFPSRLGASIWWQHWSPPGFSV
jgi:hypothetical protein